MPTVRHLSYKDYGLSENDIKDILLYCRSEQADEELIKELSEQTNSYLASYLYKSIMQKISYEKLGYVPICKNDFYAYRRKLLARIKEEINRRDNE